MKVYKFFKIPDDDGDDIELDHKYILYAITNNKEYAERFKADRNMKKFICKVHKGITKEEYVDMCNQDRGSVLEIHELTTIFNNNHTFNNKERRKVLMTYTERQLVDEPSTILDDESVWHSMPYPLIFKSKYFNMLESFQYVNYYKLMTCEHLPYELAELLSMLNDDYSAPMLLYDEVALFVSIIQSTL